MKKDPSGKQLLKLSEWIFFFFYTSTLVALYVIAKCNSYRALDSFKQKPHRENICIEISGWVRKPGIYSIEANDSLAKVLRLAKPKPFADLSQIDEKEILKKSCHLIIQRKEKIQIQVEGAVKEKVVLEISAGSRICDLKKIVALTPDANLNFFKSRKLLKDREVLKIPKKM